MDIHQVSVSFLAEQDRILVRINTRQNEEIRLWLTRRFCLGWRPALTQLLERLTQRSGARDQDATQRPPPWVAEFQSLQASQQADFKTPFKTDANAWPLGTEPLLVTSVQMSTNARDGLDLRFEEILAERPGQTRGFQASLEAVLLHGLVQLLEQALGQSQWLLPASGSSVGTAWPGTTGDEDDESRPSGYLH